MDNRITTAHALNRLLLQGLLRERGRPAGGWDRSAQHGPEEVADTLPMLYRSEAFAEDLLESHPLSA